MNPSSRRAVPAALVLLLSAPLVCRAGDLDAGSAAELTESLRAENASFCSAAAELRGLEQVPCTSY